MYKENCNVVVSQLLYEYKDYPWLEKRIARSHC